MAVIYWETRLTYILYIYIESMLVGHYIMLSCMLLINIYQVSFLYNY